MGVTLTKTQAFVARRLHLKSPPVVAWRQVASPRGRNVKGKLAMSGTRNGCSFLVGARRTGLLAGVVACLFAARADASAIVSVSGPSTTGWTFTNTSGDTTNNGNFTSAVAGLSGTWWGLYARAGQQADQTYSFASAMQAATGTNVLPIGGTIQIDVSLGFIDTGAAVGISLRNSAGTNRFETFFGGGSNTFILNDAGGEESVTGANTSFNASSWHGTPANFQTIKFTQLAGNAYSLSFDGTNVTNSGLTVSASDISQVRFFNYNAGAASGNDQFANNLIVVPEPPTVIAVVGGLAGVAVYGFRRRRHASA
jgi:hypothetical protein